MAPGPECLEEGRISEDAEETYANKTHGGRCRIFKDPADNGNRRLDGDQIYLGCSLSTWESRAAQIPKGFHPSVIAIDGPLLPEGADQHVHCYCESVFIHAPFHNRCKPGLSHWGLGLDLRRASIETCAQFGRVLQSSVLENRNTVFYSGPIVEAFPNAFLGVLMPEVELLSAPKFKRGQRFDWLYDRMVATGRLESVLSKNPDLPDAVWDRLRLETDHELRAALICLLTAAFAAQGRPRKGPVIHHARSVVSFSPRSQGC